MLSFLRPKNKAFVAGETGGKPAASPGLTVAQRKRMASRPPSFTDLLPWTGFNPDDDVFVLNDGANIALLFELNPTPTEAMPDELLRDRADKVIAALQGIPEEDPGEWIVQFYVSDDINMDTVMAEFTDYIRTTHAADPKRGEQILNSRFTQTWLNEMALHVANVSRPEGLFEDTQVSGNIWRGQRRRVRFVLYRKYPAGYVAPRNAPSMLEGINTAAQGLVASLREAEVGVRRCNGRDFYEWMLPFFNRPIDTRPSALLALAPYPGDTSGGPDAHGVDCPIFGFDIAESLSLNPPTSDPDLGAWCFDGTLVKALTLQQIKQSPNIGHFTAERLYAEKLFARFDRLPPGSMLSITIAVKAQHTMRAHVEGIQMNSRAKTPEAEQSWGECRRVLQRMALGDKLVPMFMTLYLSGDSSEDLRKKIAAVTAQLTPTGLRFIAPEDDLTPLDAFIQGLPMCFDPAFDAKHMRRSRLVFMSQLASLLPVYGRHRGTGHPGMWFWNRGGEPLWVDPLNNQDRRKNAHMLTLGPTGAGKSATLNFLCMMSMAIYGVRLIIVDAGASFQLLVQFFKEMGLSTHVVNLNPQADVSLPPFVLAQRLLDDPDVMTSFVAAERASGAETGEVDDALVPPIYESAATGESPADADDAGDDANQEKRDILGEMLISAIMMITGGEAKETDKLGRADRYLITRAIIRAAQASRTAGKPHPLAHDVAVQLTEMRKDTSLSGKRQERAEDMGQAMLAFTQGLRGKLFNRHGSAWPDVDVTLVEMGTLVQDGYEDALALAYTGLIDHVQSIGEATQHDGRHTVFLTDEGHIITTNPLLGPKIAKGTKMWRKLQIWFWLATQNMEDFPGSMSRVLSMCEWWILLTMEKAEVEQIARFKTLTKEQRLMVESARKEPPKYTEGVILSAGKQMLFRNVPPPLAIALAMTEGHEKAERRRLMDEHNCSEMEAAVHVARRIAARNLLAPAGKKPEVANA